MAVTIKPTTTESLARALPILTGVIAVGYALVAYSFLFIPKLGRMVAGGDLDLAPYNARIAETTAYESKLKGAQTAMAGADAGRVKRVNAMIPTAAETQSLYVLFDKLASANNGQLLSIDTTLDRTHLSPEGRYQMAGSVNIAGLGYEQIKRLLVDLELSERIIDVTSVVFSGEGGNVSIGFTAYAFDPEFLTAPPPLPPGVVAVEPPLQ